MRAEYRGLHFYHYDIGEEAGEEDDEFKVPPLKGLSFLDRFLVVWIFLAMAIGITLGATVPDVSSTLEKGKFVGVSLPIGMLWIYTRFS